MLAILLINLLCLLAVSAAEEDSSDIASADTDLILEESINEDVSNNDELILEKTNDNAVLSSANEETRLSEGEPKTFADLNAAINDGTESEITLTDNYTYSESDSVFARGIVINRPVNIIANGITINGTDHAGIFQIQSEGVSIQGITFVDAHSSSAGGAIYASDENLKCTVKNCTFIDNWDMFYGGAVCNVDVVNCTFEGNQAPNGGAVYNGSVVDCIFIGNHASFGGAVCNASAVNSIFKNHNSPHGALYNSQAIGCTFENNSGVYAGDICNGTAIDCNFTKSLSTEYGGSLYNCSAVNCNFTNCSSLKNGGGNV